MTRLFLLLLVALICAPAVLAQNQDYSRYEFYVGYAYERADNNGATIDKNGRLVLNGSNVTFVDDHANYNGFSVDLNKNLNRHVGIVTSFSATFNNSGYVEQTTGREFGASVQRYDLMIGPRYNWRPSG